MKLRLEITGGLGGFRLEGQLDTGELDPELAREVEEVLTAERLEAAAPQAPGGMADAQQYVLTLLPDDEHGEARRYVVDDACPVPEVLDVLDQLRFEIVRAKAASGGGGGR